MPHGRDAELKWRHGAAVVTAAGNRQVAGGTRDSVEPEPFGADEGSETFPLAHRDLTRLVLGPSIEVRMRPNRPGSRWRSGFSASTAWRRAS